jgi:hypothetical protein
VIRVLLLLLPVCAQAADLAGKHWRVSADSVQCREGLLAIDLRVRYLGPAGAVEAPVVQMDGGRVRPTSVSWRRGSKMLAEWLSAGGLRNIQPGELGEVEVKFNAGGASFEFGDAPAARLDAKKCRLNARLSPAKAKAAGQLTVHRARYPCTPSRSIAAEYPPYLPKQLLLFGRGYLPNAREVELPMGRAPAQSYAYAGPDELKAVEAAAQRAIAADFPQYDKARHFAFNWGVQKAQSGNDLYSIGVYELRACAPA